MARPKSNNDNQPNTATLTPEQQAIAERVAGQDTDWFAIGEESMNDFSLQVNPMDLDPNYPEAAKMQREKKYVFRWCERSASRVDQLTRTAKPPLRWAIVNRQNLPEMEGYVDSMMGCVCALDQILLFKPYSHAEIVNKAKAELARAKTRAPEQKVQHDDVEVMTGPRHKIGSNDVVTYEDERTDGFGDLVVDE